MRTSPVGVRANGALAGAVAVAAGAGVAAAAFVPAPAKTETPIVKTAATRPASARSERAAA